MYIGVNKYGNGVNNCSRQMVCLLIFDLLLFDSPHNIVQVVG